MLTIKSDDVQGRARTYEAIIKGETIQKPQTPEAFNVIVKELQGLGLNVEVVHSEDELKRPIGELHGEMGKNLPKSSRRK
jgi:DNA-directed RNA polymerase subunit beta